MSNKFLLKKSSVAGRVPVPNDLEYGELALNYADGRLYYKTSSNGIASLGGSTNFTQIDRQSYTATAGQTTFTIQYGVPYVDVYINGVHLSDEDYTATSGSNIVLLEACVAGDQVDLVGYSGGIISASPKANGDLLIYNSSTQIWENFPQSAVSVGNAAKWATARTLSFTGDATGSMSVDGSANASAALTLANSGVTAGSYGTASAVPVITVDAKGRVTAMSTTAVAGVSAVSYNTTSGVLSIDTSAGTTFTADIGVGTGDSPTFTALTTTGNATIGGNLTVNGTLTTINSTSLSVDDINITVADGAANAAAANGAGLTVAGANATFTYTSADDRWNLNKNLNVTTVYGALSGNASTATTLQTARNINGVSFDGSANVTVTTAGTGISVSGTAVSIDSSVVTLTGTQTLSNKSLNAFDQKTGSTSIANQTVVQSTVATTTQTAVDTFAAASYRSAKYVIQITQGSNYQVSEIMVLHNGTTTSTAEYAMMNTGGVLATLATDISGGNVRLLVTMASATSATINITRTTIVV
jgi:hypothetical protein